MLGIRKGAEALAELDRTAGPAAPPGREKEVAAILDRVRREGDGALVALGRAFGDPVDKGLVVEAPEMQAADRALDGRAREVLERAAESIGAFASAVRHSLGPVRLEREGYVTGLDYRPVASAGCYVPAGRYPLPSTALMTAVTARAAGVDEVVVACPDPSPEVLCAAALAGADRVVRAGGAQAVAALAFGTASVPAVDMVAGPGNAWVTEAKRQVQGRVGIDMLAGPSEVAVVADAGADPAWVALDMLAQWEHDPEARAWLLTDSEDLARAAAEALAGRLARGGVPDYVTASVDRGCALVFDTLDDCAAAANRIAPEHLALAVAEPDRLRKLVRHYGALFAGYRTTVPFGDYMAGPNHTLPTGRTARFQGGLSPLSFLRPQGWVEVTDPASLAADTAAFARLEGLALHAEACEARLAGPSPRPNC